MIVKNADYIISCVKKEQYPNNPWPAFVFMGRSNVGKSSLINAITNRKKLAYTSSKPGKTLTLNFYDINHNMYLVDVPGYGYAERSVKERLDFGAMIEEFLKEMKTLKTCFLIVDARHKPTEDDVLMYNYLIHYNHDVRIVATKIDKLKRNEILNNVKIIKDTLGIEENKIIKFSSLTKIGVDNIHKIMEDYIGKE